MQLKNYQQRSLDVLENYFKLCHAFNQPMFSDPAGMAFTEMTRRTFGVGLAYIPVNTLPGLPYICLRVPTGGGKTLMACHAIGRATHQFLCADRGLVLWLAPSNIIRDQTLNALKNRNHPYRQALDALLGSVTVLSVNEALFVQPGLLQTDTAILVATMQAFRVEDTEGRKVYEASGALMSHFDGLPGGFDLECYTNGKPIPSLANVLRLHRPVVIVDEAHNARTPLSFDPLARFNPSCILEFTATPAREGNPSNVLYSISAAELKAESMIKMPIRLETRAQWRELLGDAVNALKALQAVADRERISTGEYIRPIMLLQAQPRSQTRQTLTVEAVETSLKEDCGVPAEQIARATGEDYQIEGIDLSDPGCKIRYIITVQALREGWDCPFAYVLCSVAEQHGATAVEQILGRVLRMPRATPKQYAELNMAYAYISSPNFAEALRRLQDGLVEENGFERQEVRDLVIQPRATSLGPLFDPQTVVGETLTVTVETPPNLEALPESIRAQVEYHPENRTLSISESALNQLETIVTALPVAEAAGFIAAIQLARDAIAARTGTAQEQGKRLAIPVLAVKQGSQLCLFEEAHFLAHPWDVSDKDAALSESEFSTERPAAQQAEIDITTDGHVKTQFLAHLNGQMSLLSTDNGWSKADLICWLDRNILHRDIPADQSMLFLSRVTDYLIEQRGIPLDTLVREKFRLRDSAAEKIDSHRQAARSEAFRLFLLDTEKLVVTPEKVFEYSEYPYPINSLHRGQHQFKKHFYDTIGDLNPGTEEYMCAQVIDSLSEVDTWVRNLDSQPTKSFWLQTSRGRFYPDFVCRLKDGRCLVVEYKGAHLYDNPDSKEKRLVGELWERRSNGMCMFVMPTNREFGVFRAKIKPAS